MGDNKPFADKYGKNLSDTIEQRLAHPVVRGIGGGFVGAVIGGLLGRRVGGVGGAVMGAVAGAMVGKGTADRVNRTVESIVNTAQSVASTVNHNVNGVGDALKDTIEEVKPSVISVVEAAKDTVEAVKPSVISVVEAAKDTVKAVKPSVVSIVEAAKDTVAAVKPSVVSIIGVAEGVNHTVKNLGNTVKDKVEVVTPSVVSVVEAAKDLLEEVKPSFIGLVKTAKDTIEEVKISLSNVDTGSHVAEGVNANRDVENPQKDFVEKVAPPVVVVENTSTEITSDVAPFVVDEVKDINTNFDHNINDVGNAFKDAAEKEKSKALYISKLEHEQLIRKDLLESSQKHTSEEKYIQTRLEELEQTQPETIQQPQQKGVQLPTRKIIKFTVIMIIGSAILTGISVWGFSPKKKLLGIKSLESNLTLSSKVEKKLDIYADGWIFLGIINKSSSTALMKNSLIEGSKSTDSPVVPSVGAVVTITAKPGVTLRKSRPQEPNYSYQEEKALAILKQNDKLKILKVESIKSYQNLQTVKIWAEVHKCDKYCH